MANKQASEWHFQGVYGCFMSDLKPGDTGYLATLGWPEMAGHPRLGRPVSPLVVTPDCGLESVLARPFSLRCSCLRLLPPPVRWSRDPVVELG